MRPAPQRTSIEGNAGMSTNPSLDPARILGEYLAVNNPINSLGEAIGYNAIGQPQPPQSNDDQLMRMLMWKIFGGNAGTMQPPPRSPQMTGVR